MTEWEEWIWRLLEGGLEQPQGSDDDTPLDPMEAVNVLTEMVLMSSAAADLLLIDIVAQMTQRATLSNLHSFLELGAEGSEGDQRRRIALEAKMLRRAISRVESLAQGRGGDLEQVRFASAAEARSARDTARAVFAILYQLAEPDGITALTRVATAIDGSPSERAESARSAVYLALLEHVAHIDSLRPLDPQSIARLRRGPSQETRQLTEHALSESPAEGPGTVESESSLGEAVLSLEIRMPKTPEMSFTLDSSSGPTSWYPTVFSSLGYPAGEPEDQIVRRLMDGALDAVKFKLPSLDVGDAEFDVNVWGRDETLSIRAAGDVHVNLSEWRALKADGRLHR